MTVFLFHYQKRNSSYINPCIQMYPVRQNYTISISFMSFPMAKKGKKEFHFLLELCPQLRSGTDHSVPLDSSLGFVPPFTRTTDSWSEQVCKIFFFFLFFGKEMLRRAENTYAHPLRSVALSSLLGSCNTCKDQKRNCGLHWICWALFELAFCEVA